MKRGRNASESAKPSPTADPPHQNSAIESKSDVTQAIMLPLQSRRSQLAAAFVAALSILLTDLHSLPGLQCAMAVLAVNVVLTCTLGPRRRTQLVCVFMQGIPANDIRIAVNLAPSELIARLDTLHSSAHWLVFLGMACGLWAASRQSEELCFRSKVLVLCSFEALHLCSHSIRFVRTGSERFLLVPMIYYHIPFIATFMAVYIWLNYASQARGRLRSEHGQPGHRGRHSSDLVVLRELASQTERGPAASEPRRAYQKLSRLIDDDAVWEALEDTGVECDTVPSNSKPCRQHSFTTGATVLVDTNLATLTTAGEGRGPSSARCPTSSPLGDVVQFEIPAANSFGLSVLEPLDATAFAVPPLTTLALGRITPPGKWAVDGQVMHGTLYTVTLIADV